MTATPPESALDERILAAARGSVEREAQAVAGLAPQLDATFTAIVHAVLAAPGKIITTGAGTSGIIAERLSHLLAVSGTPSFYLPCLDALHGGLGSITDGDYVIAISKGGHSSELVELTRKLVERGIPVVALTENPDSPFARSATIVAHVTTNPSDADPGGLIAMGSTLVSGAWGDALASTLMRLRDHSWKDVVDIHPGGIVGLQTELPDDLTLEPEDQP
ncbi:SIS domain-containing protein [Leifsonia naganoensis]|uniref:Arabinose-5-phosphate isomerase n=1 Tax=Leifsonia naganoensis TaxID=150025 RepID=A0A853DR54_9MICO|nr:arabinose-5-phosphate isomerase [Leifsonia naganoensis]